MYFVLRQFLSGKNGVKVNFVGGRITVSQAVKHKLDTFKEVWGERAEGKKWADMVNYVGAASAYLTCLV
jgi:hypothetical protein